MLLPVLITRLFDTKTAPTRLFMQLLLKYDTFSICTERLLGHRKPTVKRLDLQVS
jgi:hypothetical protein